jgi:DNA-binding MarR family transcriptional regulator
MSVQPDLALSTWVRLLKAHSLMLRELRRQMPSELTVPQFDVLAQLSREPNGMTAGQLTRELLVTAGNVTGIVDRLEQLRLVRRQRRAEDRRAVQVRLTPRGRRLMTRVLPLHRRQVQSLLAPLAPVELARLRDLLGRLGHHLAARGSA